MHTYGSWEFFLSAAPTAQNSPELHFRFINSFIQPSLVGSLNEHNAAETLNQTALTFKNALQQLGLALGSIHVITEQLYPSNLTFQHLNQW